jgi:hypothetical protein
VKQGGITVCFLPSLFTLQTFTRSTAELEYMLQEPDVVGSSPTGATLMQIKRRSSVDRAP